MINSETEEMKKHIKKTESHRAESSVRSVTQSVVHH